MASQLVLSLGALAIFGRKKRPQPPPPPPTLREKMCDMLPVEMQEYDMLIFAAMAFLAAIVLFLVMGGSKKSRKGNVKVGINGFGRIGRLVCRASKYRVPSSRHCLLPAAYPW